MLKNLSNLGSVLNKSEQKSIKGGWIYVMCLTCDPLPDGYVCMNKPFCGDQT
ncbi:MULTISPECIES: hypothetical protein [unclassified Tenacibaculum]|uniref:hypothetical protein n=1 Tax=Tenacibaculum TaxID=104267 RepID=UPI001F3475EC|nr:MULTISPECIES: hypothetical protein [unclassified Tenacibaculum]MCF2875331.1 hypothetical protein [Tenacibaculum sp. Cn5-1]MCF2935407.1 hypothetical protein [Tenacibaculum sp. Cn5-34]MCG7511967.1 hypothetical protein [Tenacibaculum sp. Cn5-46]